MANVLKLRNIESYMDTEIATGKKVRRMTVNQEAKLSDEEYLCYLHRLRIQDDNGFLNKISLKTRKRVSVLLRGLMKASLKIGGIKVHSINTDIPREENNRPIIFVLTHCGRDDISVFSKYIKCHYTILSGDYESMHNRIEGLICGLNGQVFFDMKSKAERGSIVDKVVGILNSGDNILCSMEAAWNISPNELVYELFPGLLLAALKSNAVILPIGIERFSKKLYGFNASAKFFYPEKYCGVNPDNCELRCALVELRNEMASLKYECYFHPTISKLISIKRAALGDFDEYWKWFKDDVLDGWTFTERDIEQKRYRNRNKPQYVFGYLIDKYEKNSLSLEEFASLLCEMRNPIYPNVIRDELRMIVNKELIGGKL